MPRLFVAVWPPEEVLDRLAALPRPSVDGLRWTGRTHWHVTLRFLGQVPDPEPVAHVLASLLPAGPAPVVMGPTTERFDQRILHVPVHGLEGIAAAVTSATRHLGRAPEARPFAGHITLARVAKGARVDLRPLTNQPIEDRWLVDNLFLVESQLFKSGARYHRRSTFPLVGSTAG